MRITRRRPTDRRRHHPRTGPTGRAPTDDRLADALLLLWDVR